MDRACGSIVESLAILGEDAEIVAGLECLSLRNGDGVSLLAAVEDGVLLKLYALPVLKNDERAGAFACFVVLPTATAVATYKPA